jgi:hypothetical protein
MHRKSVLSTIVNLAFPAIAASHMHIADPGGGFRIGPFQFGRSNEGNTGGQPANYKPGNTQLQQQNNNKEPNPKGGDGDPANSDPDNSADPNKKQGSQLDAFTDLFKVEPVDPNNPEPVNPMDQPLLAFDPAKLKEAAGKMNFAAGIDAETMQKAMQDPAVFMQVINQVAQNGFAGAISTVAPMVEQTIRKNNERVESALPERVRNVQISQTGPKNPALSHPAAKPIVDGMKYQIAAKNPHLSPEKVAELAESYFINLSTELQAGSPQNQQQQQKQKAGEADWTSFLN